jgi:hypothetical protein
MDEGAAKPAQESAFSFHQAETRHRTKKPPRLMDNPRDRRWQGSWWVISVKGWHPAD